MRIFRHAGVTHAETVIHGQVPAHFATVGGFRRAAVPPVPLSGAATPGRERRGELATPDGELGQSSRLPLNGHAHERSPASGPCAGPLLARQACPPPPSWSPGASPPTRPDPAWDIAPGYRRGGRQVPRHSPGSHPACGTTSRDSPPRVACRRRLSRSQVPAQVFFGTDPKLLRVPAPITLQRIELVFEADGPGLSECVLDDALSVLPSACAINSAARARSGGREIVFFTVFGISSRSFRAGKNGSYRNHWTVAEQSRGGFPGSGTLECARPVTEIAQPARPVAEIEPAVKRRGRRALLRRPSRGRDRPR